MVSEFSKAVEHLFSRLREAENKANAARQKYEHLQSIVDRLNDELSSLVEQMILDDPRAMASPQNSWMVYHARHTLGWSWDKIKEISGFDVYGQKSTEFTESP